MIDAPEHALAEGFAHHVARWARERGASAESLDALVAAARAASLATSSGDVCVWLEDVAAAIGAQDVAVLRARLLASTMVDTSSAPGALPLVLDDDGRLYLHRYFDYERRFARRLAQAARTSPTAIGAEAKALLETLFARNAQRLGNRPDWQKIATALALQRRLAIVSGGPGTGKTTTVVNVLACALTEDPDCRIRLAAPTGKAAARMQEAIRKAAAHLAPALRERMPAEAYTVHRLLGVQRDSNEFRHNAGNPLPVDLLVVDEASMLDLALATRLVEAVPPDARIILLGDKDQLAAVESGAVFAELCADPTLSAGCIAELAAATGIAASRIAPAAPLRATPLVDSVIWLTENFRFAGDSGIGVLAAAINRGDADAVLALLRAQVDPALEWIDDASPAPQAPTLARLASGLDPYLDAARGNLDDKAALFDALGRFRVLCAERAGPRGVESVNAWLALRFREELDHPRDPGGRSEWYPGRPVMVLANDYVLQLFNGDVGIALPDATGTLMVHFPSSGGGFRAVAPLRLPRHETAFATTVHKAQGSEFERVLVVLPARANRGVTRELLYTAVTRARAAVAVVGGDEVLACAVQSPTQRRSGLIARLAEAV